MKIIILAMRRSGTTVFWKTICRDQRFRGFNEPFNPALVNLAAPDWPYHSLHRAFHDLLNRQGAEAFWQAFSPIFRYEELQTGLSDRQANYLSMLAQAGDALCFDVTRCHFKIASLHTLLPDACLVHLYRPPQNFATSVFLPSDDLLKYLPRRTIRYWRIARRRIHNALREPLFFTKRRDPLTHGYGELTEPFPQGHFAVRLEQAGLDPAVVFRYAAVGRLLALWKLYYDRAETDGRHYYGARFLSINFHDFCRNPAGEVGKIYAACGEPPVNADYRHVSPPKPAFRPDDPRWQRWVEDLGLPQLN